MVVVVMENVAVQTFGKQSQDDVENTSKHKKNKATWIVVLRVDIMGMLLHYVVFVHINK